jgi:hypothetical protein
LIFGPLFFEIYFFKNNAYLIDLVLVVEVCGLFIFIISQNYSKNGCKNKANYHPRRGPSTPSALADTPAPPCRAGSGGQTGFLR